MCAKDDGTSKSRRIKNAARSRRKEQKKKKYCNFLFHGDVELHGYLLDGDMTRDSTADVDVRLLCRNATVRGAKMSTVSVYPPPPKKNTCTWAPRKVGNLEKSLTKVESMTQTSPPKAWQWVYRWVLSSFVSTRSSFIADFSVGKRRRSTDSRKNELIIMFGVAKVQVCGMFLLHDAINTQQSHQVATESQCSS